MLTGWFLAALLVLGGSNPSPLDDVAGSGAFGFASFAVDRALIGECSLQFIDTDGLPVDVTLGPHDDISAAVFYPATVGGTERYPLVALVHGFGKTGMDYSDFAVHLATWGFIVAVVEFDALHPLEQSSFHVAVDALNVLEYVSTTEPFASWIDPTRDWSAVGHSMGGVGTMVMTACDDRVRTIVPMVPPTDETVDPASHAGVVYGSGPGSAALASFDGAMYLPWAEQDEIVIPASQAAATYVDEMRFAPACNALGSSCRNVSFSVTGALHSAPLDNGEVVAHTRFKRIATGALRAELYGEEDWFHDLIGSGADSASIRARSHSARPLLWTDVEPGVLTWGYAATPTFGLAFEEITFGRTFVDLTPGGPTPTLVQLGGIFVSPPTGISEKTLFPSDVAGLDIGLQDGFFNASPIAPSFLSFTAMHPITLQ